MNRARLKVLDVALSRNLENTHAPRHGFLQGARIIPMVLIDAIRGDDGPGAVGPTFAVHKDALIWARFEERQEVRARSMSGVSAFGKS